MKKKQTQKIKLGLLYRVIGIGFLILFIVGISLALSMILDKDGLFYVDDANWWTRVLCYNNGEIRDDIIYQTCINETGEYRAKFYGGKYFGNTTSSWSPYWHMKQIKREVKK